MTTQRSIQTKIDALKAGIANPNYSEARKEAFRKALPDLEYELLVAKSAKLEREHKRLTA
jgi:hypothetical protein